MLATGLLWRSWSAGYRSTASHLGPRRTFSSSNTSGIKQTAEQFSRQLEIVLLFVLLLYRPLGASCRVTNRWSFREGKKPGAVHSVPSKSIDHRTLWFCLAIIGPRRRTVS